ncbi:hypothetical protein D3250_02505 [Nesterenkonia natronophila]|uniref:Sensor domain-containing protein n=1 Tax=Nesterenkonia natronophila TaxID=2174932 RepID=A0A3A4FJY7_9MICC|nr:hypothetical protein D3250_02505 [Nesterenkonia natronophila]
MVSVFAVAAIGLLTGCGGSSPSDAEVEQQGTQGANGATTGAEEPATSQEDASGRSTQNGEEDAEPHALTDEEKLEVLLSTADMPVSPEGHSTYESLSYFQESIAVEYTLYQETFDESECSAVMDRINIDLIGEEPQSGLAHAYTLPAEEGSDEDYRPHIYVWVLSYDRGVDTSSVWNHVHEHCTGGQLASGTEEVEIAPFTLEDSAELRTDGISMVIHRDGEPIASPAAVRHSMTVDFGDNLVMLSAVGLDDSEFAELAAVQAQKLADHAETLDEEA